MGRCHVEKVVVVVGTAAAAVGTAAAVVGKMARGAWAAASVALEGQEASGDKAADLAVPCLVAVVLGDTFAAGPEKALAVAVGSFGWGDAVGDCCCPWLPCRIAVGAGPFVPAWLAGLALLQRVVGRALHSIA